jgi:arsenical pump membrane protein
VILALALALLAATLAFAVVRPRGLPEVTIAVPAAIAVVAAGWLSLPAARAEADRLGPTVGFLAAVLVLARLCAAEGVFAAAGAWMARAARGSARRLLALVFMASSLATAALSLDSTVVLLTPVVFATAVALRVRPRPHVFASVHLANTASLLLPVSNLTNLLAFAAAGLSFTHFAALMALPWLAAIGVEWLILARVFADDLSDSGVTETGAPPALPRFSTAVLVLTLLALGLSSLVSVDPAWLAGAGAAVMAAGALVRRRATVRDLLLAVDLPFLAFVLSLALIVAAADRHGLSRFFVHLLPDGASLGAMLAIAAIAALLANLVNNLPAILILLPALSGGGAAPVLAALIGVNVGPNLTYAGSLATLLWRRTLRRHDAEPDMRDFLRLGVLTVPAALVAATVSLWLAAQVIG